MVVAFECPNPQRDVEPSKFLLMKPRVGKIKKKRNPIVDIWISFINPTDLTSRCQLSTSKWKRHVHGGQMNAQNCTNETVDWGWIHTACFSQLTLQQLFWHNFQCHETPTPSLALSPFRVAEAYGLSPASLSPWRAEDPPAWHVKPERAISLSIPDLITCTCTCGCAQTMKEWEHTKISFKMRANCSSAGRAHLEAWLRFRFTKNWTILSQFHPNALSLFFFK